MAALGWGGWGSGCDCMTCKGSKQIFLHKFRVQNPSFPLSSDSGPSILSFCASVTLSKRRIIKSLSYRVAERMKWEVNT